MIELLHDIDDMLTRNRWLRVLVICNMIVISFIVNPAAVDFIAFVFMVIFLAILDTAWFGGYK